eukprot:TRINITY_DN5557_c0_g1_i1.p1 TRINITY_DN5557_c0_g1~~TRINITY_DN5557_c0_g1_i1.p1  ORF type:complete len:446 (+),score=59.45 TRINITY_DN5557_c0_g1_i1:107-1444(+)
MRFTEDFFSFIFCFCCLVADGQTRSLFPQTGSYPLLPPSPPPPTDQLIDRPKQILAPFFDATKNPPNNVNTLTLSKRLTNQRRKEKEDSTLSSEENAVLLSLLLAQKEEKLENKNLYGRKTLSNTNLPESISGKNIGRKLVGRTTDNIDRADSTFHRRKTRDVLGAEERSHPQQEIDDTMARRIEENGDVFQKLMANDDIFGLDDVQLEGGSSEYTNLRGETSFSGTEDKSFSERMGDGEEEVFARRGEKNLQLPANIGKSGENRVDDLNQNFDLENGDMDLASDQHLDIADFDHEILVEQNHDLENNKMVLKPRTSDLERDSSNLDTDLFPDHDRKVRDVEPLLRNVFDRDISPDINRDYMFLAVENILNQSLIKTDIADLDTKLTLVLLELLNIQQQNNWLQGQKRLERKRRRLSKRSSSTATGGQNTKSRPSNGLFPFPRTG